MKTKELKTYEAIKAEVSNVSNIRAKAIEYCNKRHWEMDIFGMEVQYQMAVIQNLYDKMFFILECLEESNYHTEYQYFLKQDWNGLFQNWIEEEEAMQKAFGN